MNDYQPVERKAVFIKSFGWLGFTASRKMLHDKWLYFIFTDAGYDGWALAMENELIWLE